MERGRVGKRIMRAMEESSGDDDEGDGGSAQVRYTQLEGHSKCAYCKEPFCEERYYVRLDEHVVYGPFCLPDCQVAYALHVMHAKPHSPLMNSLRDDTGREITAAPPPGMLASWWGEGEGRLWRAQWLAERTQGLSPRDAAVATAELYTKRGRRK